MKKLMPLVFASCLSVSPCAAESPSVEASKKELRIIRITPDGQDVPAGRQIVFEFNRPVVPIGKMDRTKADIPVAITPELNCEWRWLNTTSLSCNLDEKSELRRATKYSIVMNPGIKAEDGATIVEAYRHEFITERPDIRYRWFQTWKSPSSPVIRITLNQSVTKQSLEEHVWFAPASDLARKTKLVAEPDPNDAEVPQIIPVPGEKYALVFGKEKRKSDDDLQTTVQGLEARRVWLIKPVGELPVESSMSLRIEPGLVSAAGSERGVGDREVVQFDTYPDFRFAGVKCRSNDERDLQFLPEESSDAAKLCNPLARISLSFSVPVLASQVKKNFEFVPDLAGGRKDFDPWGPLDDEYSRLRSPHKMGNTYDVALPQGLKAAQRYSVTLRAAPAGSPSGTELEDEFGRKLQKPFTVSFTTDHRRPNFEITHHEAVIEKNIDSEVPLYVNNLQKTTFDYRAVTVDGVRTEQTVSQNIPQVSDIQFAVPFNVRSMLEGKPGAVYGQLRTEPAVSKIGYDAYRLFAQVTPYQLHVKLGHFSTLVWVSDLATGNVVQKAKVTIYKETLAGITAPHDVFSSAVTDDQGIALLPGTQEIDPQLELSPRWDYSEDPDSQPRLFVRVEKDKDMALMPLSKDFEVDAWRASGETISSTNKNKFGHIRTWGTTAQGIYRAGDTIQYKFYVRNQDDRTLVAAPRSGYTLEIVDPTGKVVDTVKELTLSEFGAYSGEFSVPKQAAIGWYRFRLIGNFAKTMPSDGENEGEESEEGSPDTTGGTAKGKISWQPMRVLVSDFTPAPFRVTNGLNGDLFRSEQEVEVTTAAKLHSGGAYTDASARITALIEERPFTSQHPVAKGFLFSTGTIESGSRQIYQQIESLDPQGELRHKFKVPPESIRYGKLMIESAVQDDRGKYIAALSQADFIGVDRFVGLRSNQWLANATEPASVLYVVVDEHGAPAKGTNVDIAIERRVTNAARVKGEGNAYITNFTTDWKQEGKCSGVSEDAPLTCTFTPAEAGSYRLTANIKDTKGNPHATELYLWVVGKNYVLWDEQSDSHLQIVPEKAEYHVGETARYLVRNPYPGAKALVTVERYGMIDRFVRTFEDSTPVVEFPVKADYLPGFYLSVLIVSPRADKPLEDGQVDLGKPTFRLGYIAVPVKDPHKEMTVTAKAEKEVYRPRDKVKVKLHAEPKFPSGKKEPIEFTVAVLDEAVFDLVAGGKSYFDPYQGFYQLESLDLRNYSLLTRLVGRQKFEKKGANPGGDGGSDLSLRNLFKFVSYWNPSITADKNGNAQIEFEAPDNLTGWRILALASTPTDRLGLGDANFKVNRPTEIRPVMPNQVTEGDEFNAGFSVMNRTEQARTIEVTIEASGNIDGSMTPAQLHHTVMLEPYKRTTVLMPIRTGRLAESREAAKGKLRFTARAGDQIDKDGVEHFVPVGKIRSLETAASYGTTTEEAVEESVAFPQKIHTDVGSVSVVVSPSVIASLEGAFRYLKNYPYPCWEQLLTRGAMASHYRNLKSYLSKDFEWAESEQLPDQTLALAANFQAPNGGMVYFIPEDRYVDPYLSAYTALAFNWLRHSGYKIPERVETALHQYLLELLKREVAPDFYSEGMSSTIRAVALAALAEHGKVGLSDLERFKPHVQQMSLFGKTHFVQAATKIQGGAPIAIEVTKLILSHANQTGGKFIFNEELDDSYLRILASPLRENCAILETFTALQEKTGAKELVQDVPFKLVRTITQTRKNRDHWENTQENMFCMNALVDYSKVYESVKPVMSVKASMEQKPFGETRFRDLRDKAVTFERPILPSDPGRSTKVRISRQGAGRLYYTTRLAYAPLDEASSAQNSGIEIRREYSVERANTWTLLKSPFELKRGELVRVDLYLSLPASRNFVVVDDPVPGGLEPINRDIANTSVVDAKKGEFQAAGGSFWFKFSDWITFNVSRWSFYHQEIRHDSVRFYADYLPPGNYHLSYTAQAIAEGSFVTMPEHAEEMYDPDVYGKGITAHMIVQSPPLPAAEPQNAGAPTSGSAEEKEQPKG